MIDFSISLSREDKVWADWIAWQLTEGDYSLYYQLWDFQVGQTFELQMEEGVRQAPRVLIVVSPNHFNNDYTMEEFTQAVNRDPAGRTGTIVPVWVMLCDLRGSRLGTRTDIDLVGLTEPKALVNVTIHLEGNK